jgi:hypothetical protein
VIVFFVTSSDSGSLVIDTITAGGKINAPVSQRVFWVIFEGLVAAALLLAAGWWRLQAAAVSTGPALRHRAAAGVLCADPRADERTALRGLGSVTTFAFAATRAAKAILRKCPATGVNGLLPEDRRALRSRSLLSKAYPAKWIVLVSR